MIYIVGHTAIDYISTVTHLPKPNSSTGVTHRKMFFGGGAANIAAGIATLGEPVTLISAVGSDFDGSEYDRYFDRIGVNKQFYKREGNTATAFMFTDPEDNQVTFFEWGASVAFADEEAPALPFVHMATANPDYNVQIAEKAAFSSFDPGQDVHLYTKDHLNRMFNSINILIANNYEYETICKTLGCTRKELVNRPDMAIETLGKKGCILYMDGKSETIQSAQVNSIDPTGAGDGFRSGFLTAYKRGYSPVDCCRIGCITASFVVEAVGCQTNLSTFDMMVKRYESVYGSFPEK